MSSEIFFDRPTIPMVKTTQVDIDLAAMIQDGYLHVSLERPEGRLAARSMAFCLIAQGKTPLARALLEAVGREG